MPGTPFGSLQLYPSAGVIYSPFFGVFELRKSSYSFVLRSILKGSVTVMTNIKVEDVQGIRILTLAHEKPTNPVGKSFAATISNALREADADDSVSAIVMTGGKDRCFSAGGDFNEVREVEGDEAVNDLIDWCTDLYLSVLDVRKPLVAAIDHHAVGLGFQLAMMFDWRIMSTRADMFMPELEHGIGASVGATIFATTSGYDVSRHIVMSCRPISAEHALSLRMADEVCEPEFLVERAVQRAVRMGKYPRAGFSATKKVLTDRLRNALENTREQSKAVHREAFRARAMHKHFNNVLGLGNTEAVGAVS
ncbi:enoyl-CoA hydratase/isomerase family protein [Nocardia sp. NPDC059764]|uniref:enoyl-CoA hydratase/isomerase family protein n=1 Tax=Nocardia sp. NPDC059764 TaxID=3346939 RepID=UPI00366A0BC4